MITVRLKGGLGNQMFQYAFAKSYSIKNNCAFQLDIRYLNDRTYRKNFVYRNYDLDLFVVNPLIKQPEFYKKWQIYFVLFSDLISKKILRNSFSSVTQKYHEIEARFNPVLLDKGSLKYFDGYFQSFNYFDSIKPVLINEFSFKEPIETISFTLLEEIKEVQSICINVRRGDFLTDNVLEVMDANYFYEAVEIMKKKILAPVIYVFSDDLLWCRENLHFDVPVKFVSHDYAGKKFKDYFELMKNCKYFIIPNSTFAWWAAYLCNFEGKMVVAPLKWFKNKVDNEIFLKDMIPLNWIKI